MQSDQKKIVLNHLVFLPLVALLIFALNFSYISESDAATSKANQHGSATKAKICADKLCTESREIIISPSQVDKKPDQPVCFSSRVQVPCDQLKFMRGAEKTIKKINPIEEKSLDANVFADDFTKANVPVTIPLHQGYYSGKPVYYIITDSSDKTHADIITKNQGWRVELAPLLANASQAALSKTYMFTNGVKGDGVHGFQGEVFTSTPAQPNSYSALTSHVHVTWDDATTPRILDSEKAILSAEKQGLVTLHKLNVVLNMPQVVWPEGQMPVKANTTLTDKTPFVGGQVLDINLENMTTTFIAHRGWDADGKTIYHIVTDATPVGPAISMGVTNVPKNAALALGPAAADVFHFMNGILGAGPMGFQTGISSSAPGDEDYSPMSRIYFIAWKDPKSALLLQTKNDVDALEKESIISVDLAKPMNADHIVNAPIIDPFQ